jgi:hypothetical protein
MERIPNVTEKDVKQQAKKVFRSNVRLLTFACIEHAKGRVSQDSLIKIIDSCRNSMALSSDKLIKNLLKKLNGEKESREAVR